MNMNIEQIEHAAKLFGNAIINHESLEELPPNCIPRDQREGFEIQDAVVSLLERQGYGAIGGHKVGLVTAEIRASATGGDTSELGWDTPVYTPLNAQHLYLDEAEVRFDEFIRPRIEGEFAVKIGEDIPLGKAPFTRKSISDYVESCMAGIEIVDWRLWYWDYNPPIGPLLLADICSNCGAVFSEGSSNWRELDLPSLSATLTCNGEIVSSGVANALLGHPFEVLAWTANHMAERSRVIRRNEKILLGSVTKSYADFTKGDELVVNWDEIGSVRATFS